MANNLAIFCSLVKAGVRPAKPPIAKWRGYAPTMGRRVGVGPKVYIEVKRILIDKLERVGMCVQKVQTREELNESALGRYLGIPQRTIANMLKVTHDVYLGNICTAAKTLGVEPWQLLHPDVDAEILDMISVFKRADDDGKKIIRFAIKSAKEELTRKEELVGVEPEAASEDAGVPPNRRRS